MSKARDLADFGDDISDGVISAALDGDGSGLTGVGAEYYEQTNEPSSPSDGAMWYDPSFGYFYLRTQSEWVRLEAPTGIIGSKDTGLILGGDGDGGINSLIQSINITIPSDASVFGSLQVQTSMGTSITDRSNAITGGGSTPYSPSNKIEYIGFVSGSTSSDFGDLTSARNGMGGAASTTRGLFAGGEASGGTRVSTIDYITFSVNSNASSFGSLSYAKSGVAGASNGTRAVFSSGKGTSGLVGSMDYVTIATAGNATYFGVASTSRGFVASASDGSYAYFAGGSFSYADLYGSQSNVIDKINIDTTGNATATNTLTVARTALTGMSNGERAVFAGGLADSNYSVGGTIDYISMGTNGYTVSFGSLSSRKYFPSGTSGFSGA